ncbi:MAG: hypothetical protein Q9217_005348 [Psora testacea]
MSIIRDVNTEKPKHSTEVSRPSNIQLILNVGVKVVDKMLDWLMGPAQSADAIAQSFDEGASCLEEPPETPAHVFAVRAFKTALFGTPHPEQTVPRTKPKPAPDAGSRKGNRRVESSTTTVLNKQETPNVGGEPGKSVVESMLSPTKGILLTPGMGTSRRKNVSFVHSDMENDKDAVQEPVLEELPRQDDSPTRPSHRRDARPRPSSFTKTLIELSKLRSDEHLQSKTKTLESTDPSVLGTGGNHTDEAIQTDADHTIDLCQPRSRSGQHWKAEYEQYYRRSDREMKKLIKYGQNVKSYAVKKDSEASRLAEKLQKELVRMASMESKVSKLAARLNVAQAQDDKTDGDQARLISELAQQTALTVKYKQKVDQYRKAIQKQSKGDDADDTENESQTMPDADDNDSHREPQQEAPMDAQLESLQYTARSAEDRAAKLEAENAALKRSLARVKEEMMSYESRRQAREDRLKKREEKHQVAKETAENQLAQLRLEHQKPLAEKRCPESSAAQSKCSEQNPLVNKIEAVGWKKASTIADAPGSLARKENKGSSSSISPRKRRPQEPAIDVWTISSPRHGEGQDFSQSRESTELPPSSVKHDIHRALKDIDLNLITDQRAVNIPPPKSRPEKPTDAEGYIRKSSRPAAIPSTERPPTSPKMQKSHNESPPSTIHITSSPAKLHQPIIHPDPSSPFPSPTAGRSASLSSHPGGSRTGTMSSARTTSAMTAERAATAKARLARRSAEKRSVR